MNTSALGSLFVCKEIAKQQKLSDTEQWQLGLVGAFMPSPLAAAIIVDGLARSEKSADVAEHKQQQAQLEHTRRQAEIQARNEALAERRANLQSIGDISALPERERERAEEDLVRLEEDVRRLAEDERRLEEDIAEADEGPDEGGAGSTPAASR